MNIRRSLTTISCLSCFLAISLWQGGCGSGGGSLVPSAVFTNEDPSLPSIFLTNLSSAGDPALVGIGNSFRITWSTENPPPNAVVKLTLSQTNTIDNTSIEISPTVGVDASANGFDFAPTRGLGQTGIDYFLIAQLRSGSSVFDTKVSVQKIRIGDGGVVITYPTSNITLASGLPLDMTWDVTNNICEDLKSKIKIIRLYADTTPTYRSQAIELTEIYGVDACLKTFEINTGEFTKNTPYYVIARLFIDGVEHSRTASSGTFTTTASMMATAPLVDVQTNLQSIPVSWQVIGRDSAGLKVEILAQLPNVTNDPDRVISDIIPAEQGTGIADGHLLPFGTYDIVVRLFEIDDQGNKIILDTATAPGKILLSGGSLRGNYDLSDMSAVATRNYSPVEGVVFEGYNIQDQAGFEVAGVGDINGDNLSDFLIFCRYGQEYTAGNAGSAYLIYGKTSFASVIGLNNVATPTVANRLVDGTIIMFPMENLAEQPALGQILGSYTAIGLPDVSGDGNGDLFIGCPDAAPLTFHYANQTTSSVSIVDYYGMTRSIGAGGGGYEPAHVPVQFQVTLPWYSSTIVPILYYGATQDNRHYLPGDMINITFKEDAVGVYSELTVDHDRRKRGATYLLTSQRLSAYFNGIYDLNKVGSPVEDLDNTTDTPTATMGGGYFISYFTGKPGRSQMMTWESSDGIGGFGSCISVAGDIDADNSPELLVSIPNSYATDLANPNSATRIQAGMVKLLGSEFRQTSNLMGVGTISWLWPEWLYAFHMNGSPSGTDGVSSRFDIIGSTDYSTLTGAAGLGRYDSLTNYKSYTTGDFNGDSVPDIVVGSPGEYGGSGSIYVIPIRPISARRVPVIDLADFNKAQPPGPDTSLEVPILGVKLIGTDPSMSLGKIVKPVGDFNGDGLADIMYAMPNYNNGTGRVIIMFGRKNLLGDFTVDQLDSHVGTQLPALIFDGQAAGDHFGQRIVAVYDVNGDGVDDILIAAPDAGAAGKAGCGKIYLIYGKMGIIKTYTVGNDKYTYVDYDGNGIADDYWPAGDLGNTLPGAIFIGETAGSHLQAISPVGDVNGDGVGDLILGSPSTDVSTWQHEAGKAYLIFGRR
ncbi:MAG: hypothetical protein WC975_07470 [Phycisphaerae bacterium]